MTRSLFLCLLFLCTTAGMAHAQRLSELDRSRYSPAAYYNFSEPGDVTILVNVWGSVRNPGLYEIPQGTRMNTLLSIAGGPDLVTSLTARNKRFITLRLLRNQGGEHRPVIENTVEDEVVVTSQDPVLEAGDVLILETRLKEKFSLRDVFPVVAAIGTIALAIERISNSR